MTSEQKRISLLNYQKAADYFDLQPGEMLHHTNPEWKHDDIERYIQWNVEDLVVMTKSEHMKWHWQYNYEERCRKISEGHKGKSSGAKGKHWHWHKHDAWTDESKIENSLITQTYLTVAELLGLKE